MRLLGVDVITDDFQQAGFFGKAFVDELQHLGVAVQALFDVEQQNLVELRHSFGGPVVALHQRFAGLAGIERAVFFHAQSQALGDGMLQIKHQAVFATLGGQVQTGANQRQHVVVAFELFHLKVCGQTFLAQALPAVAQARGLGNPQHHLQIAQAAGRLFAVGLQ